MSKSWKHYTAQEKVAILRRHLVEKEPVSKLCEELQIQPTVFYRWQKQLFENGAAAFENQPATAGRPSKLASRGWRRRSRPRTKSSTSCWPSTWR